MGTLFIKYPNLKGFFTSFYTFDCISIPFLNSAMSTFFFIIWVQPQAKPQITTI